MSRPLHTQDCEPVSIALQALSLVKKVEPVQARFTLRLRDQRRECKVDVKSTWIPIWHQMDHVSRSFESFSKPPLGGRRNTKLRRLWHFKISQLIFSHLWIGSRMNRNSLKKHLVEGPVTNDYTLHLRVHDHSTWFWKCLGLTFGHFFWALTIS